MNSLYTSHALLFGFCLCAPFATKASEASWTSLLPDNLRRPVAVSLTRNPMQPHFRPGRSRLQAADNGELAERLLSAMPDKFLGMMRGDGQQVLMIGRRCLFPGMEIPLRPSTGSHPQLVSARLKSIEADSIVFLVGQITSGEVEMTEVALPLAPFFRER